MRSNFFDPSIEANANEAVMDGSLCVGDTIRFNHKACDDKRRRCYVTRKHSDDGNLVDLCYCHNCAYADVRAVYAMAGRSPWKPLETAPEAVELPEDWRYGADSTVPSHIQGWLAKYDIQAIASWSPSMSRIILPVYHPDVIGRLMGYQARRDPEGSTRVPKYLTVSRRGEALRMRVLPRLWDPHTRHPPTVVLVEDWISAHRFRDKENVVGVPLFGLNVNAEYLLWVEETLGLQPQYLVWLDNDVPEAKAAREYLQRLLAALGRRVSVVTEPKDPKDASNAQVASALAMISS